MDHAQDPLADTWQSRYYPNMRSRALLERTRLEEERYDSLPPVTSSHPFRGDVPSYYQNSATSNSDDRSFDTADSDSDPFLPSIQDTLVSATDHPGFHHSPLWQNRESVSADSYLYSQYGSFAFRRPFLGTPLGSPVPPYDMQFPRRPERPYYSPCVEDYMSTPPFSDVTPQAPSDEYEEIPRFHSLSAARLSTNNGFPEECLFPGDSHGSSDPFWSISNNPAAPYHPSSLANHLSTEPADWLQTKKEDLYSQTKREDLYSQTKREDVYSQTRKEDLYLQTREDTKSSDLRRGSLRRRAEGKPGVKETLESVVQIKKVGRVEDARRQMEQLLKESPTSIPIYVELIRLMMDSGDFQAAREYLKKALVLRGDDEQLLERSLRVEERMGNLSGILQVAETLMASRRYRNVKLVVDACMTMAKLGAVEAARSIFDFLIAHEYCRQGNLVLSYVLFVYRSVSVEKAHDLLGSVTQAYSKHGPLWFFTFAVLEHRIMVSWDKRSMLPRVQPQELLDAYVDALQSLSIELRWKVFYLATQMLLRTVTQLRLAAFSDVHTRPLSHADHAPRLLPARCRQNAARRHLLPPGRLRALSAESPVESVASRCARQRARRSFPSLASGIPLSLSSPAQCFARSAQCAPVRNAHSLFFEIARLLDFEGAWPVAQRVIVSSMQQVPLEWKLWLERIQQLVSLPPLSHSQQRDGALREALELNRRVVESHRGAGRLWASLIQLVHR